jgi:membrane peptidoglycan carboxypeptidase
MKKTLIAVVTAVVFILALSAMDILSAYRKTPSIIKEAEAKGLELSVKDLSAYRLDALLKIEDPSFYTHKGVDFSTPGQGLTTITQALVKILYFRNFKPGLAKLRQTIIARFVMDPQVSKDEQLKLFINMVYLGNAGGTQVYGFGQAAKAYYNKPFSKLTDGQFLSLLAMVIAPSAFNIITTPKSNETRVERIKKVISGEYKPKGLLDVYYGKLTDEETGSGIAPASYFPDMYK